MWLMTTYGYFSVTLADPRFEKKGKLQVRARRADDLFELQERHPRVVMGAVKRTPRADYLYRCSIGRRQLRRLLGELAGEVDYRNFKDAVKRHSAERAHTYMRVWSALLEIEGEGEEGQERTRRLWVPGSLLDDLGGDTYGQGFGVAAFEGEGGVAE